MGYYGKEKIRQMSRSILPCVAQSRKSIKKDLNARRRKNRRDNNQLLQKYRHHTVDDIINMYYDSSDDFEVYVEMHQGVGWDDIVQERRDRDHLNHFIRWAKDLTKDMDPQDRYPYMKSIMPKNAMGAHAMTHLELELDPQFYNQHEEYVRRAAERRRQSRQRRNEIYEIVKEISASKHETRMLNDYFQRHVKPISYRLPCSSGDPSAIKYGYINQYYKNLSCKIIPQLDRDYKKFFETVFQGKDEACCLGARHRHSDWYKTLIQYIER